MHILPAVDIRGGLCVNLVQGDYHQETVFSKDPVAQAAAWHDQGGRLIHVVDLDGAKEGRLCAGDQLRGIAKAGIPFEVGGGIRNMATIEDIIETGADRVILGTAAFREPTLVADAAKRFPGKIAVGIDAKAGKVALSAWLEVTDADAIEFAKRMQDAGAARIIYTDILSDGMMKGPNFDATRAVAKALQIPVTASGGISSLADIRGLRDLEADGVDEAIVGRALYLNVFTVNQAIAVAEGRT